MMSHLPVLQVIVPLLTAPLCALVRHGRTAWAIAVASSWISLWMAWKIFQLVQADGAISYNLGGWPAPIGIEYKIDALSAFVLIIVTLVGAVVTPYALKSVGREVGTSREALFYAAFLLCLSGLLGIVVTGDMFNVFVFLEISSLSAYALIALGRDRRALTASYQYLIMGSVGATFIVIGIGMLYVMTGSLNMADLAILLPELPSNRTIPVAFAFLSVGVCLKLALFPLHMWLPNAYAYAPSAVTAFIASTATKVAIYMLLRFFFTVFGVHFSFSEMQLGIILLPLSLIAIFSMSLVAIFQTNVKRMLAYSSLAQIGYIILGISFFSNTGLTAGILHLFNHAIIKGSLFMALGCVMYRLNSVELENMRGLGKKMPLTMGAFMVGGFSLIGVPFTAGFVSKWYLIQGAIEKGLWPVALLILMTSLMAVVYIWRVVESVYFSEFDESQNDDCTEAPLGLLLPTWALALLCLYFGINATLTTSGASLAAANLLGIGS
ncbi:MAG: monovalent cation/H+ antiporter subunit D family protein [bacterium]